MKNINLSFVASAVLAASAMIAGNAARAEELPQTKAHQRFSVTQGFGQSAMTVFHRASAENQKKVGAALIEKLGLSRAEQSSKRGDTLHVTGRQWALDVTADGAGVDYRDASVEARAHSLGKPLTEKMSAAELEKKGRAFIADKLASQIVLGADEELVAVRADYRTEGGDDLATGEISQAVVANRIVFGRTIRGVPVVGNGSKVILTFLNDGSLESFRYDWPRYQTAVSQNVVDAGEILSRVQMVISVRDSVTAPKYRVAVPSNEAEAYPVELTPNTKLQALECGFYDGGSFATHASTLVQPGCTYRTVSQDTQGMRVAYAGAVPAGTRFELDAAWLETQILGRR